MSSNANRPLSQTSETAEIAKPDATAQPLQAEQPVAAAVKPTATPAKPSTFWGVFLSTFITIFLAEMGDKTQVTTLLMAAEFHAPWIIFAGAGSALIATSLVGVLIGQWLAKRISPAALDRAAGLTLLGITCWLLWDLLSV